LLCRKQSQPLLCRKQSLSLLCRKQSLSFLDKKQSRFNFRSESLGLFQVSMFPLSFHICPEKGQDVPSNRG
jgi:hypothetical protein